MSRPVSCSRAGRPTRAYPKEIHRENWAVAQRTDSWCLLGCCEEQLSPVRCQRQLLCCTPWLHVKAACGQDKLLEPLQVILNVQQVDQSQVVCLASPCIYEHFICFLYLLEPPLGDVIALVPVWMPLPCQAPVG